MEVAVRGHALEPSPSRNVASVWALEGGGLVRLSDDGGVLTGCGSWPGSVWTMRGVSRGRVAKLDWVDIGGGATGKLMLGFGDDGSVRGSVPGWRGKRTDSPLDCRAAVEDVRFAKRLESARLGVVLAGVSFDATSDEVRLEATNELGALERLLSSGKVQRARVLVLGRTAEPPPDELKRCERRAQRLLQAMHQRGVPEGTIEIGVGLLKVGAAVQLEPRVEVLVLE